MSIYSSLFKPSLIHDSNEQVLLKRFFEGFSGGKFLDIGANRAESAISFPFLKLGWSGLAVDPIPENHEDLLASGYKSFCGAVTSEEIAKCGFLDLHVAGGEDGRKSSLDRDKIDPNLTTRVIRVPLITLRDLLRQYDLMDVDFISIDVEGHEVEVIDTLPNLKNLKLLLVEDWGLDTRLYTVLSQKGFKRVLRTGYNSWYVPKTEYFPISLYGRWQLFFKMNLRAPIRKWKYKRRLSG